MEISVEQVKNILDSIAHREGTMIKINTILIFSCMFMFLFLLTGSERVFGNDLKLSNQNVNIRVVEEDSKIVQLELSLDLLFTNTSSSNIVLYRNRSGLIYRQKDLNKLNQEDFWLLNLALFTFDKNKARTYLYGFGTRRSNFVSPEVLELQNRLSVAKPPSKLTIILKKGESVSFKMKTECTFSKTRSKYDSNVTWQELLKATSVFMTITLEMFPHYLNTKPKSNVYFAFGKEIQKKWSKYGYLWLDDIVSEPIPLDLSSDIPKTDSN